MASNMKETAAGSEREAILAVEVAVAIAEGNSSAVDDIAVVPEAAS